MVSDLISSQLGLIALVLCVAVKSPLTAKPLPLSKDRQGEYLTATQIYWRTRSTLRRQIGFCRNHLP
jgi:hypothetical protein